MDIAETRVSPQCRPAFQRSDEHRSHARGVTAAAGAGPAIRYVAGRGGVDAAGCDE